MFLFEAIDESVDTLKDVKYIDAFAAHGQSEDSAGIR